MIEGWSDQSIERAQEILRNALKNSDRDFREGLLISMWMSKGVKSVETISDILEDIKKSGDRTEQGWAELLLTLLNKEKSAQE